MQFTDEDKALLAAEGFTSYFGECWCLRKNSSPTHWVTIKDGAYELHSKAGIWTNTSLSSLIKGINQAQKNTKEV